ncbi:AraC family transcriptional regulator [Chondrinema litorale]|uniref:AraC family transcriptional regulator n=1 Tax=Chondrinema litorale TaxID=2994555 RepID=UPI0025432518|nr:AraC family transcriptional regulator [Chondrinema litorale]UZR99315.1 AraC family transcriptional regulator [Chondrinema litorale]
MEPVFEKIEPNSGSSFFIEKFEHDDLCHTPYWHIHPEYEIVYIKNGNGVRCVGSHISNYRDGELIMLGPHMPHQPFGNKEFEDNIEIVIQFGSDFFTNQLPLLPETSQIKTLLQKSKQGITFSKAVKEKIAPQFNYMVIASPLNKLLTFIKVLDILAKTKEYELLKVGNIALEISSPDYERMNKIYELVSENYQRHISLEEVSELCQLSPPSFCRFFKKITRKSFVQFLTEYRIVKVQELMHQKRTGISSLMYECGFNEASYFSRQFKKITGKSPSAYRKLLEDNIIT